MNVTIEWTTVILAVVGGVVTVLTAYIAKTTRDVHFAVNTNYQNMAKDLEKVTAQLAALATLTATQAETIRGADTARVLAAGQAAAAVAPLPVEIVSAAAPVPVEIVDAPPPAPQRRAQDGALD